MAYGHLTDNLCITSIVYTTHIMSFFDKVCDECVMNISYYFRHTCAHGRNSNCVAYRSVFPSSLAHALEHMSCSNRRVPEHVPIMFCNSDIQLLCKTK